MKHGEDGFDIQAVRERHLDDLIRLALFEIEQESADALTSQIEDGAFELTDEELDRLLKKTDQKIFHLIDSEAKKAGRRRFIRHTLPRIGQIAAALLLVFAIGTATAIAAVPSVRVRVMKLLIIMEKEYASLSLVEDTDVTLDLPDEWKGRYFPQYIPEGFVFSEITDFAGLRRFTYTNDERRLIFDEMTEDVSTNIDIENADITYDIINGWEILFSEKNGLIIATWAEFDQYYDMIFEGEMAEMKEIIRSLLRIS